MKTIAKTTKKQLEQLRLNKLEADKAYFLYRKAYIKEHPEERSTLIKDIIDLHKQGKTNKEIVEMGYNKNTVGRQICLYKKGKKTERTTVRQYL